MTGKKALAKAIVAKVAMKEEEETTDILNQKIAFLQSIPLFQEIDAQYLMPVACNIQIKTFSFGEYIVREGEIPKGLYLIKSGQCKVASARIAEREYRGNYDLNKKLVERKKLNDK